MYNIKQITNFDIKNASVETKQVIAGGDIGYDKYGYRKVQYKIISQNYLKGNINKFGYCCESKAIQFPIFLTINGIEKEFQIGKTGMFELQPETWIDINENESEEHESNVLISEIKVPWQLLDENNEINNENYQGFNFKLDFIYSII